MLHHDILNPATCQKINELYAELGRAPADRRLPWEERLVQTSIFTADPSSGLNSAEFFALQPRPAFASSENVLRLR